MKVKLNNSKKIAPKVRENLRKISEARSNLCSLHKHSRRSAITVKQYTWNEVIKADKIELIKHDHKYTVYNIGLPTKSFLQGDDRKSQAPWFIHEDSERPVADIEDYPQYTFKHTANIINKKLRDNYVVNIITSVLQ